MFELYGAGLIDGAVQKYGRSSAAVSLSPDPSPASGRGEQEGNVHAPAPFQPAGEGAGRAMCTLRLLSSQRELPARGREAMCCIFPTSGREELSSVTMCCLFLSRWQERMPSFSLVPVTEWVPFFSLLPLARTDAFFSPLPHAGEGQGERALPERKWTLPTGGDLSNWRPHEDRLAWTTIRRLAYPLPTHAGVNHSRCHAF